MGGGDGGHGEGGGDFRSKVWSMSGGPNCRPKHWRRNTAFALFGIFLVCVPIAVKSAQLEVARQPDSIQCGYYVCRFMLEVIRRRYVLIPEKYVINEPHVSE